MNGFARELVVGGTRDSDENSELVLVRGTVSYHGTDNSDVFVTDFLAFFYSIYGREVRL